MESGAEFFHTLSNASRNHVHMIPESRKYLVFEITVMVEGDACQSSKTVGTASFYSGVLGYHILWGIQSLPASPRVYIDSTIML